ncbi:MAG: hypothetical protein ACOC2E_07590 [Bacteroidota bacterium]
MEELFITNSQGKRSLFPVIVAMGEPVENIFAIPARDAIGTIDIDNAISFLEFNDDNKVKINIIKKDFAEEVSGEFDFSFLPVYSNKEIAYGQTRWMIFQNIETKHNRTEFIINNLDDLLGKITVIDPQNSVFVVETLKPRGKSGREKGLLLADFSDNGFKIIKEISAGIKSTYNEPWTTSDGKLFIYEHKNKQIRVYDKKGNPANHPIRNIFAKNRSKFRRVKEMVFHPELPFAVIVELGDVPDVEDFRKQRNNGLISIDQYDSLTDPMYDERDRHAIWLLRWDTPDSSKQLIPLMSLAGNLIPSIDEVKQCSDFQFSPDGKWLVFRDETEDRRNPVFISIPVSDQNPFFFGKPLYLGKVLREGFLMEAKGTAWIHEPTSFVVTDGLVLYKWELGSIDRARVINKD